MKVPFSPPDIREQDIEAVVEVLRSGWITSGPVGEKFRKALTEFSGTAGTMLLNSATAGLKNALRFLGIGPGDEVIVPAYTYTASASVVAHVGAKIVMVDVEPGDYFPSAQRIRAAITQKTKAIIPVDLAGRMVDTAPIYEAIEDAQPLFHPGNALQETLGRIALIIDGAHSLGATGYGMHSGQAGDFTAFSFHAVKNLTTAEGGALTWRTENPLSDQVEHFVKLNTLHGQSKSALEKTNSAGWEYDVLFPGYKENMPDTLAALGYSQLQRYPQMIARRHQIIDSYSQALADLPVTALAHSGTDAQGRSWNSSGHLYLLSLDTLGLAERNQFIEEMFNRGISCNVHYKPLPMLTAYRDLGFKIDDFPNAYEAYCREVTLPLNTVLDDAQVEYVQETAKEILSRMTK